MLIACTPTGAKIRVLRVWAAPGMSARMPMVISRDTPLPMPRWVICSPSHINSIVPAVMKTTEVARKLVLLTMMMSP